MAAKNKAPKYRGVENKAAAEAAALRARSGAWGTHDNREHRQRTRSTAKKFAISQNSY